MLPHPLNILKYKNITKMNRDLMGFIQGIIDQNKQCGVNIINLDEYKSVGTHWIVLYVTGDNVGASNNTTYFDSSGIGHIPKEI